MFLYQFQVSFKSNKMFKILVLAAIIALVSAEGRPGTPNPACQKEDTVGTYPVILPGASCTTFYLCSRGNAYPFDCPPGLHFNAGLKVCDWPADAGCA